MWRPGRTRRGRVVPLVVVGVDAAVPLPDASDDLVLQVPLDDVLTTARSERPVSIVLVASADQLAESRITSRIGRQVRIATTVLQPSTVVPIELARVVAPSPPELVTLPSGSEPGEIGLARLRQDLREQLGDGVRKERRQDAELCLTELVANAARHGWGEPTVTLGWSLGRLRVSVRDRSPEWPSPGFPSEEGGRGLRLIHAITGVWGVCAAPGSQGKDVWFELDALPVPDVTASA